MDWRSSCLHSESNYTRPLPVWEWGEGGHSFGRGGCWEGGDGRRTHTGGKGDLGPRHIETLIFNVYSAIAASHGNVPGAERGGASEGGTSGFFLNLGMSTICGLLLLEN